MDEERSAAATGVEAKDTLSAKMEALWALETESPAHLQAYALCQIAAELDEIRLGLKRPPRVIVLSSPPTDEELEHIREKLSGN